MHRKDQTEDVKFFIGTEVEHTPAYNMKTLFVVGIQSIKDIEWYYHGYHVEHIFFGANHSFNVKDNDEFEKWENMIEYFLEKNILCSLDIPVGHADEFLDSGLVSYDNFIPQLYVSLPFISLWNYNTMFKIDDKDFQATNPGVWTHNLHDLMNKNSFTPWRKYAKDEQIK
jgi:hypothetical protein